MTRWAVVAPALALVSTGCLASKSDIRLLQDELRANRSQLGVVDTSIIRTNEQRRQQIASLSAAIDRMNDSLRVLAARFSSFQATANGEFDSMGRQMVAMQALLGQTTRNVQDTRTQLEALKEQGTAGLTAQPAAPTMRYTRRSARNGSSPTGSSDCSGTSPRPSPGHRPSAVLRAGRG